MQSELVSLWQSSGFAVLLVMHDVEEALFLANRVLMFSDRPARITAEVAVDLPYPRHRGDPRLAEFPIGRFASRGARPPRSRSDVVSAGVA